MSWSSHAWGHRRLGQSVHIRTGMYRQCRENKRLDKIEQKQNDYGRFRGADFLPYFRQSSTSDQKHHVLWRECQSASFWIFRSIDDDMLFATIALSSIKKEPLQS